MGNKPLCRGFYVEYGFGIGIAVRCLLPAKRNGWQGQDSHEQEAIRK